MAPDNEGILASEIGAILSEDFEYPLDGTLLHAEVEEGMTSPSIFKDGGSKVIYRIAPRKLTHVLLDLWRESSPDKRWAEIEYWIQDGKFELRFVYPEEIDRMEDEFDRRDRIVKRYFGERPIVYPPLPSGDDIYQFEP